MMSCLQALTHLVSAATSVLLPKLLAGHCLFNSFEPLQVGIQSINATVNGPWVPAHLKCCCC